MTRQAFGLAFDIERSSVSQSGYIPAKIDLGSGKELFGDLRLKGFATLLRLNIVDHLTIVGGDEGRYKDTDHPINRANAIRQMLIHDYAIDPANVSYVASKSNTLGNVGIIKDRSTSDDDIVVTNLYHCTRAVLDTAAAGLRLRLIPAEAFLLLKDRSFKNELIERLGGGPLAERCAEEIQGIADKLAGTYQSRTDAVPVTIGSPIKA
jgi:hypothetical protein